MCKYFKADIHLRDSIASTKYMFDTLNDHIMLDGEMRKGQKSLVPYSQLTVCAKWTCNVHYYGTYKEQESQKHVTTSCSGTKPFY